MMGITKVGHLEKYLGIPAAVGRNKAAIFAYIKEKVWRRLNRCNKKFLSTTGKEILLKVVA